MQQLGRDPDELVSAEHHEIRLRVVHEQIDGPGQLRVVVRLPVKVGDHQNAEAAVPAETEHGLPSFVVRFHFSLSPA